MSDNETSSSAMAQLYKNSHVKSLTINSLEDTQGHRKYRD